MTTVFEPSAESIQMLLRQVDISEDEAKQYLTQSKGNTFNAICYALGEKVIEEDDDIDIDIDKNDTNPNERIEQFRNVLDKRDQKFMEMTQEDDNVMDEVHNVGFIPFKPDTTDYSKENYKMTLRSFLEIVAKPFVEKGILEEYKSMSFTEIRKDPNAFRKNEIDEEEMKIIEEENERIKKLDEERKALEQQLKDLEENENKVEENNIEIDIVEETDDGTDGNLETTILKDTSKTETQDTNKNDIENIEKTKPKKNTTDAIREQLSKFIEEKVAVKPLTGLADKMVRKWRCSQAGIIYKESNVKSSDTANPLESIIESNKINKLATKIMINSRIIKKNEYYVGNAIVVDKWYYYLLTRAENEESEKLNE
jgi:hypothetical protein